MEKKIHRYLPLIVAVTMLAMSTLACAKEDAPAAELTPVSTAQAVQPVDENTPDIQASAIAQSTQDAAPSGADDTPASETPTATSLPPTETPLPTISPAVTYTPVPATLTPEPSGTEPSGTGGTYTVKAGDNLFRIALNHGTTVNALASANHITNPALIFVGQVLTIPGSGSQTAPTGGTTYVVQPGDNLFRIALRYNMSYITLAQYNNIANPSSIYVGQVIHIP